MWLRWLTRPFVPALLTWGAVCLFLFFSLDAFLMPWAAGRFAKTAEVPRLTGLSMEKAAQSLSGDGLSLMLDTSSDFSDMPAGRIMSQFPPPGETVKRGRRVWVRVSKGRRVVLIPTLRGMSQRQAEISLQEAGLRMGSLRHVSSADAPAGAVIGSHPGAQTKAEQGQIVGVDISSGADPAVGTMPSLLGLSLSQARNQIETLHLTVGQISLRPDPKSLPQTVLSQSPSPGALLKGAPVDLVVSQ